tara:strand:+ start:10374 stop:10718 length:345 start_codon:yes stop_codon:yes gene_type:complete
MITVKKGQSPSKYLPLEIERLERLLADLKRIRDGDLPSKAELTEAPLIDEYAVAERTFPVLQGYVHGHPALGTTWCRTTELWVIAPDLGWVRTLSRFYRLGMASFDDGGSHERH